MHVLNKLILQKKEKKKRPRYAHRPSCKEHWWLLVHSSQLAHPKWDLLLKYFLTLLQID
jgi:hypothetical protein